MLKVCAISDLHGALPEIRECDVLFICGDIFPLEIQRINSECETWFLGEFCEWIKSLPCKNVYMIGGNHCFYLFRMGYEYIISLIENTPDLNGKLIYLQDNLAKIDDKLTIYGCPWCTGPINWAFIDETGSKYSDIPDCDILLCHQPPRINKLGCSYPGMIYEENWGSEELKKVIKERKIRYCFCGHIHTGTHGGDCTVGCDTMFYNVSLLDEDYKVAYMPTYLEIN